MCVQLWKPPGWTIPIRVPPPECSTHDEQIVHVWITSSFATRRKQSDRKRCCEPYCSQIQETSNCLVTDASAVQPDALAKCAAGKQVRQRSRESTYQKLAYAVDDMEAAFSTFAIGLRLALQHRQWTAAGIDQTALVDLQA